MAIVITGSKDKGNDLTDLRQIDSELGVLSESKKIQYGMYSKIRMDCIP